MSRASILTNTDVLAVHVIYTIPRLYGNDSERNGSTSISPVFVSCTGSEMISRGPLQDLIGFVAFGHNRDENM